MPSIKSSVVQIVLRWDDSRMEGAVMWMAQSDVLEALILLHKAVADNLNLWLVRYGFQVRVQDRAFRVERLAVAIRACSIWVELLRDFILRLRRDVILVLEDQDLMFEKGIPDSFVLGIWKMLVSILSTIEDQ